MASQLRFNTAEELANNIIAKLNQEELSSVVTKLEEYIHSVKEKEVLTVDVKSELVTTKSEVSQDKMWLYTAKTGWALDVRKAGQRVQNAAKRLEEVYKCEIIGIKTTEGKINFVPTNSNTINELVEKGLVVYRPELNKRTA